MPFDLSSFKTHQFYFDVKILFGYITRVSCWKKEGIVAVRREWQNSKWACIWQSLNAWNILLSLWENFDLFFCRLKRFLLCSFVYSEYSTSTWIILITGASRFSIIVVLFKWELQGSRFQVMLTCTKLDGFSNTYEKIIHFFPGDTKFTSVSKLWLPATALCLGSKLKRLILQLSFPSQLKVWKGPGNYQNQILPISELFIPKCLQYLFLLAKYNQAAHQSYYKGGN